MSQPAYFNQPAAPDIDWTAVSKLADTMIRSDIQAQILPLHALAHTAALTLYRIAALAEIVGCSGLLLLQDELSYATTIMCIKKISIDILIDANWLQDYTRHPLLTAPINFFPGHIKTSIHDFRNLNKKETYRSCLVSNNQWLIFIDEHDTYRCISTQDPDSKILLEAYPAYLEQTTINPLVTLNNEITRLFANLPSLI